MTTNISVQEITSLGLSEPKTITLTGRPSCDRIQHALREALKSDDVFLLNQELFDNISIASYNSTTFKYYRTSAYSPETGDLVCRNGAILSAKHESIGQTLDDAVNHEELSSEECDKLLSRLPQIEDAKYTSTDSAPLPVVENVLPSESVQQARVKVVQTQQKSVKPLRAYHSFSDWRIGSQCLAFDFNQPVQPTEVEVRSKPELPEGKWRWVSPTRLAYSANRFPGSTEFKLSLGPIVQEDGTKVQLKEEYTFSTSVVDIDSVHVENTKSPVVMVIFNQRAKSKLNMFCVDVSMIPYTPTEDVKTLYKTPSIIAAYERAMENGVTVLFFKPERWPLNSQELTFKIGSGNHSEEGPLPSRAITHKVSITSAFTIRALQWTQIPINTNPTFQFSLPIHPECITNINDYIHSTADIEDIIVQGDRVCVKVPQKEMEFEVTFKSSLMSTDGITLASDYSRKYTKFRATLCVPTGSGKITNIATPSLQMIVGSSKCEYSINSATFSPTLVPQVGVRLGGGEIDLPNVRHEMRIFTIDLARYFEAEPNLRLLAVVVKDQGTYFVQKTDWIVDTFAHENGTEVAVYTKDLKIIDNPTIMYNDAKGELVPVKDKGLLPPNVTTFKVEAEGNWAVFNVPEVVPGNKQKIDLYATTDRGLYQPGEKAHIIGFARDVNGGIPTGTLKYSTKDGHSTEILKGTIGIKNFDFEVLVPTFAHPGEGYINFLYNDEVCHHMKFSIKEFRIPDNEVLISSSQDLSTNTMNIDTEVKSFIGDDVAGANVTGSFVFKNGTMSLPQYPEFSFYTPHDASLATEPLAKTNGELGGSSRIKSTFSVKNSTSLVSIEYKASTRLKNGERLEGSHVANVRPRGLAVGVNIKKHQVISAAFPFSFEAIVIDENNAVVDGVNVYFEFWAKMYNQVSLAKEFVKQVHRGETIPVALQPGEYFVQAYVSDTHGNVTTTRSEVFDIGNDAAPKSAVLVNLDKNEYDANEIAKVNVSGLPSYFKRGLCNIYVKSHELVKLSKTLEGNGDFTIDLPLNNNLAPRASVYCSIIGIGTSVEETDIHVNLVGSTTLNIRSERDVKFSVNVTKNLGPSEKSQVTCEFEQPLSEDIKLTVWAVDDAVLKLAKYVLEHPLEYLIKKKTQYKANTSLTVPLTSQQCGWTAIKFIYVKTLTGKLISIPWNKDMTLMDLKMELQEQTGIPSYTGRLIYFGKPLQDTATLAEQGVLPGARIYLVLQLRGDGGGGGSVSTQDNTPIVVRKSNGPLAWFKTVNVTKGNKSASIEFEASTDLKRYKVFVLAVGATLASKQEGVFDVTKPFSISALVLRQLCIGDKVSFPVTLYNREEHDMIFKVAARTKSLTVSGAHGFSGTIKANSSTCVAFDLTASQYLNGAIQVVAVGRASGEVERSDAIEYPVRVNSLTVRRGVFGKFENKNETRAHAIDITEHMIGSGEVNVNISPSVLSQGVEALTYLGDYRYMCSEQMSSQLLVALPYLKLGSFVRVPNQKSPAEITSSIKEYVKALEARHMGNGRFSYWTQGSDYSAVNIQVAHALVSAKLAGFGLSPGIQYSYSEYLKQVVEGAYKSTVEKCYAAYVLHLLSDGSIGPLLEKIKTMGKSAKSTTALAYLAAIPETGLIKTFAKKIEKSIAPASDDEEDSPGTWTYFSNIPKLCSLTILALLENKGTFKDEELMTRAVGTLLSSRRSGHWMSTHANMWALTALAQYHEKVEKHVGEVYTVKAWLGKRYLGELSSNTTALKLHFDTSADLKSLPQLTLQLTGAPVWYSVQMKLDSKVGEKPASARFTIDRRLYGLERADDVTMEQKDGRNIYRVKHGAHVAVEVNVQDSHYDALKFFAVQDPVAAGLEPSEKIQGQQRYRGHSAWDHIDIRLDGADAFADYFYGRGTYTYKALALRKGTYTMPSSHVEEMYNIDNFGDSDTATVIIDPDPRILNESPLSPR